jgi:hypothetical protein
LSDREPERHQSGTPESRLPNSYYLDESDPDVLVLRREDHTFVAAFSAMGATREGIVEAAREDYAALLERPRTHQRAQDGDGEPVLPPATANGREEAETEPRHPS